MRAEQKKDKCSEGHVRSGDPHAKHLVTLSGGGGERRRAALSGDGATRLCHMSHRGHQVIIGIMTSDDGATPEGARPGGGNIGHTRHVATNTQLRPA